MRWFAWMLLLAANAWAQSGIQSFSLNTFGSGVDYRVRVNAPLVTEAPFGAEERSASGVMKVYRDGEGRTRLERAQTPALVEINDPKSGVFYVLNTAKHAAYRVPYTRPPAPGPGPLAALSPLGASGFIVSNPPVELARPEERSESLGTRMFDGVEAEGQRATVTYPVGAMGNAEPSVVTQESWYAAAIQATVLSIHRHPQTGEVRTELVNVKAGEPDAALFRVPEGYTVTDQTPLFRVEP